MHAPITASMLYDLVACPHRVTMDIFADPVERDEPNPFVQLLWERGTLQFNDLTLAEDGSGTVLIRRSKTDAEGQGSLRYLAPDTVTTLTQWLFEAGISDGKIIRSLQKGDFLRDGPEAGTVPQIFKCMATNAGLSEYIVAKLSGQSTRVGAAQDMVAAGLEVTEVMQAGGWKSPVMVARSSEHLQARRGAAPKLAEKQRRIGEVHAGLSTAEIESEEPSGS